MKVKSLRTWLICFITNSENIPGSDLEDAVPKGLEFRMEACRRESLFMQGHSPVIQDLPPVMDYMFSSLPNPYVKVISPNVMVFGSGPPGRCLGLGEVMNVGSS